MYTHIYIFEKIKFTTTNIVFAWCEVRNCLWWHRIHFLLVICCWTCSLSSVIICFSSETHLEKTKFSFVSAYQWEMFFLIREEGMCRLLFLASGVYWVQANACPVNAALVFVVHMCINSADLKDLVFFQSSINSGSYILLSASSLGYPELWREGCDGGILFRTEYFQASHSLHNVWQWVCIFFFLFALGGSISDDGSTP